MNQFKTPNSRITRMVSLFLSVTAATLLITLVVRAWEEPTCDPDTSDPSTCNVDAPINVGSENQTKVGGFIGIDNGGGDALRIRNGGDLRIYTPGNTGSAVLYVDSDDELVTPGNLVINGTGGNVCHQVGGTWYSCRPQGGGENLAETLAIGNSAGSYNINMNGNNLENAQKVDFSATIGSHPTEDGVVYRYSGQAYLAVDDNLYIRDTNGGGTRFHFNTNNGNLQMDGDLRVDGGNIYDPGGDLWVEGEDNVHVNIDRNNNDSNRYFAVRDGADSWRLLAYENGDVYVRRNLRTYDDIFVGSSSGDDGADLYLADKMYDWDNTSYYVNPAGTSNLKTISVGNYLSFYNGGYYYLGGENTPDAESTGVHLETNVNPSSGSPIFVVESSGGSERLRVEHDGWTSTSNSFEAGGDLKSGNLSGTGDRNVIVDSAGTLKTGSGTPEEKMIDFCSGGGIGQRNSFEFVCGGFEYDASRYNSNTWSFDVCYKVEYYAESGTIVVGLFDNLGNKLVERRQYLNADEYICQSANVNLVDGRRYFLKGYRTASDSYGRVMYAEFRQD